MTQYCFQYKDLGNDLETINDLEEGNKADSDKDTVVAEKVNESKFEKILKKYYVDMI